MPSGRRALLPAAWVLCIDEVFASASAGLGQMRFNISANPPEFVGVSWKAGNAAFCNTKKPTLNLRVRVSGFDICSFQNNWAKESALEKIMSGCRSTFDSEWPDGFPPIAVQLAHPWDGLGDGFNVDCVLDLCADNLDRTPGFSESWQSVEADLQS